MKVGLIPINIGHATVGDMIALARKAEAVGVESVPTPFEALDRLGDEMLSKMN